MVGASVPLGGGQCRHDRQRPRPRGPRDGDQQHQAAPAQPAGLDEVRAAGADRVVVDAFGGDLGPAPPLERLIHTEDERSLRSKRCDQQAQQDAADRQPGPLGLAEHAVIAVELFELGEPQYPQRRRDRPTCRTQQATRYQDLNMRPHAPREQERERSQRGQDGWWQGTQWQHRLPYRRDRAWPRHAQFKRLKSS